MILSLVFLFCNVVIVVLFMLVLIMSVVKLFIDELLNLGRCMVVLMFMLKLSSWVVVCMMFLVSDMLGDLDVRIGLLFFRKRLG